MNILFDDQRWITSVHRDFMVLNGFYLRESVLKFPVFIHVVVFFFFFPAFMISWFIWEGWATQRKEMMHFYHFWCTCCVCLAAWIIDPCDSRIDIRTFRGKSSWRPVSLSGMWRMRSLSIIQQELKGIFLLLRPSCRCTCREATLHIIRAKLIYHWITLKWICNFF